MALGSTSASNRNEYQEYFLGHKVGRCVTLTPQPSCAYCHEIWKPQPPETLRACPDMNRDCFTFFFIFFLPSLFHSPFSFLYSVSLSFHFCLSVLLYFSFSSLPFHCIFYSSSLFLHTLSLSLSLFLPLFSFLLLSFHFFVLLQTR